MPVVTEQQGIVYLFDANLRSATLLGIVVRAVLATTSSTPHVCRTTTS